MEIITIAAVKLHCVVYESGGEDTKTEGCGFAMVMGVTVVNYTVKNICYSYYKEKREKSLKRTVKMDLPPLFNNET